jgi:SAM-dependent methyltransferase
MRLGYITKQTILNFVAPIVARTKGRGSLGIDADLARVPIVLHWFSEALAASRFTVEDKDILELGPGRTSEVLSAFVVAGGRSGEGLDVSLEVADEVSVERLKTVAELLVSRGQEFLSVIGSSPARVAERLETIAGMEEVPIRFRKYDGRQLPLPAQSIDLAFSRSVFEHVHQASVEPLLNDLRRVLRPQGLMIHFIDLRDHMRLTRDLPAEGPSFSGSTEDWLDALSYRDWLFRAMFSRRPVAINRMRVNEWCEIFERVGFNVVYRQDYTLSLPKSARSRLQEPWGNLPEDILRVAQVAFALQATSATD